MGDDLRLFRGFAQDRQKIAGKTHQGATRGLGGMARRVKPEGGREHKGRQNLPPGGRCVTWMSPELCKDCTWLSASLRRVCVNACAYKFQFGNKIAFSLVMTTELTSVTVPPRKAENSSHRTAFFAERLKSWEGESPTARAYAAASTTRKSRSRQVAQNIKTSEQGFGPALFLPPRRTSRQSRCRSRPLPIRQPGSSRSAR